MTEDIWDEAKRNIVDRLRDQVAKSEGNDPDLFDKGTIISHVKGDFLKAEPPIIDVYDKGVA